VLRGVVVAGLGLDRSEKRATPWVSPWWWLASVGPDLRKAVWISPEKVAGRGSLLVVVVERKEKKKISRRADPSWVSGGGGKPRPKKISHAVIDPAGRGGGGKKRKAKKKGKPRSCEIRKIGKIGGSTTPRSQPQATTTPRSQPQDTTTTPALKTSNRSPSPFRAEIASPTTTPAHASRNRSCTVSCFSRERRKHREKRRWLQSKTKSTERRESRE
jgi:hypothetical protein